MRVDHASIWVSDLERTNRFYDRIFEMDEIWRHEYIDDTKEVFLGNGRDATFQVMYRPGSDIAPEPGNYERFVVTVDDLGEKLDRLGSIDDPAIDHEKLESSSRGNGDAIRVRDFDGYRFELVERD